MPFNFGTNSSSNAVTQTGGSTYLGTYGKDQDAKIAEMEYNLKKMQLQNAINQQANGGQQVGTGQNYDDLAKFYQGLFGQQFENTKALMGLTNQFRQQEGATQGQMDAQTNYRQGVSEAGLNRRQDVSETGLNTRQSAQIAAQKFLATTAVQENRDADLARARSVLKRF